MKASSKPPVGRVIGFIGAKGGVGTTTLVLNIAAKLARPDRSVVVAEMFLECGSASPLLRQTPSVHLGKLLDASSGPITRELLDRHLVATPFGFRLLFAPPRIDQSEQMAPARAKAVLDALVGLADLVMVDLHNIGNPLLKEVVRGCEFISIVLEPEPIAIQLARSTHEVLASYGIEREAMGAVVVNRAALTGGMMLSEIESQLGSKIVGAVPPASECSALAHKAGSLLVVTQPDSKPAAVLAAIAGRFAARPVGSLQG